MKQGKIYLVGFGPGAAEHMTFRARSAIAEADVVIGYTTYIKLVQDLLAGKEVIRKGMTEELDRCTEAYEQAQLGKVVALISSGDIGVYGMAGPTFEVLLQAGWTPASGIQVEVVPGATALSACAALVGAPLTHDFCSISLSDLLTPWPVIARRLESAARGDFVVALYNPKSGRRTQQIVEAQRLLLNHRAPGTPVAIVKSAYRDAQKIQMVTLDHMADCDIGMLTTVLVGNSSTFMRDNLMVTPRGYANKYDALTGETHAGEKAGRSLTMGLSGWKACVRKYLRDPANQQQSLTAIAQHFGAPLGQIVAALGEATPADQAGMFRAVAIDPQHLNKVMRASAEWGPLRASLRAASGSVSELSLRGADFEVRGEWLNVMNAHFHLHIHWAAVTHAWFVSRDETRHGVYFVDQDGAAVFNLFLEKQAGVFDAAGLQHYQQAATAYAINTSSEVATHE